jgi:hypothetical protein
MVYLNKITEGVDAKIAAKLEIMEPCSSVKDRYPHRTLLAHQRSPPLRKLLASSCTSEASIGTHELVVVLKISMVWTGLDTA